MPKILKIEYSADSKDQASVQIQFTPTIKLWFDVWLDDDGEFTGDWNKYIFTLDNEQDMKEKAFQDASNDEIGAYNFSNALEIASQALDSKMRLEYLREQLEKQTISYSEIAELQDLAEFIDPADVQLLEAAGIPEFAD